MKYLSEVQSLMHHFYHRFIGGYLRMRIDSRLTKAEKEHIASTIDEVILRIGCEDRRNPNLWHVAGKAIKHPSYNGDETLFWLGTRAITAIEKFVNGHADMHFNDRVLDVVAAVCGFYGGFYGYLQGKRWPDELIAALDEDGVSLQMLFEHVPHKSHQ